MMMNIRSPVEEEKPLLLKIFNEARASAGCFKRGAMSLAEFGKLIKKEAVFVAEVGEQIVGFVSVWEADAFIHHLYIAPRFQRNGFGQALLQMCEQKYGRPLSLKCICANVRALNFYKRNGWVTKGYGTGPDGPWERLWLKSVSIYR